MRMAFSRRCERAIHGAFGVAFVSAALVGGQSAPLPVGEFGFFQFGHAAVTTSIERERCG
jgi:hypothetical protein